MQSQAVPQPLLPPASPARPRPWRWLLLSLGIALLLFMVSFGLSLFFKTYINIGPAMQPTLSSGDTLIINKGAYLFSGPSRGEVIVFYYPPDPTQVFIKRVIAIPGDTIKITTDQVIVNGVVLHEPYITQPVNPSVFTLTLKSNEYFVMGDNRTHSSDSRSWGPVPSDYIIGKAIYAMGPQGFRSLSSYPDVFSSIH